MPERKMIARGNFADAAAFHASAGERCGFDRPVECDQLSAIANVKLELCGRVAHPERMTSMRRSVSLPSLWTGVRLSLSSSLRLSVPIEASRKMLPRSPSSGISRKNGRWSRHDAHVEATIHYRFHPYAGMALPVIACKVHRDVVVLIVDLPDSTLAIPEWMARPEAALATESQIRRAA